MNEDIDFYRKGRQYAFLPQSEYMYDDLPKMSYEQTIEFNRGYADCIREQKAANRTLFVLFLVTVAAAVFFWWIKK